MFSISGIVKPAMGVAFAAVGYAATAHPVTLVALAALPWAAHHLSQCCSSRREPAAVVPAAPAVDRPANANALYPPVFSSALMIAARAANALPPPVFVNARMLMAGEEAFPAPAAAQGLPGVGFDMQLAAAVRQSQDSAAQAYVCPYQKAPYALRNLNGGAVVIPESLLYEKADGTKCNLAHYLATLLFQPEAPGPDSKDFLGNFVDPKELREMSEMLGFTLEEYTGIWREAKQRAIQSNSQGCVAELEKRFEIAKEMLANKRADNIVCEEAIRYLSTLSWNI